MNARKPGNWSAKTDLNPLFKLASLIFSVSVLVVLVATLFPFNFSFQDEFSLSHILYKFQQTSTHLSDRIKNLLLFLPFGFSLMCLLEKKLGAIAKLTVVLLASASLSLFVEVFQAFLPSREPTSADILNNTISGLLGAICFYFWKFKIFTQITTLIQTNKKRLSTAQISTIFIGYLALTFISPIFLQHATSLNNWDINSPLLVGNEKTGNRPWRGYVSEIYIADRAIFPEEVAKVFANNNLSNTIGNSLLAHYQLTGQSNYSDRTGNLPNLTWHRQANLENSQQVLAKVRWLETKSPVNFLNQRLRETAQFTIGTTVATARRFQTGPARIISISTSTSERNLTIGQQGDNLSVRLRTPINGKNAQYLAKTVPDVFADTNPHHIVVTYAGSVLRVYIDTLENFHSFNLLELLPKSDKFMYYGIIFIPIGFLLALVISLAQGRFIFYPFLCSGILLPAFILEVILASDSDRAIQLDNVLLGIVITAFTAAIFQLKVSTFVRQS